MEWAASRHQIWDLADWSQEARPAASDLRQCARPSPRQGTSTSQSDDSSYLPISIFFFLYKKKGFIYIYINSRDADGGYLRAILMTPSPYSGDDACRNCRVRGKMFQRLGRVWKTSSSYILLLSLPTPSLLLFLLLLLEWWLLICSRGRLNPEVALHCPDLCWQQCLHFQTTS